MFWLCKSDRYDEHLYVINIEYSHAKYYYGSKNLSHVSRYSRLQPVNLPGDLIRVCVPYTYLRGVD